MSGDRITGTDGEYPIIIAHATEKALLVYQPKYPTNRVWLPISQIEVVNSTTGEIVTDLSDITLANTMLLAQVPDWLAQEKELLK